jgi:hypothetical protein
MDDCSAKKQTPAFLEKLFDILEENSCYSHLISWQPDGNSFLIKKVNEFSEIVLPKYFKHSNIQSYIRQLNMYGFSKTRHDSNHREFTHKLFQRGRRDLLQLIKRKTQHSNYSNRNDDNFCIYNGSVTEELKDTLVEKANSINNEAPYESFFSTLNSFSSTTNEANIHLDKRFIYLFKINYFYIKKRFIM